MSQATKVLDDFYKKERRRNIVSALVCLVLFAVLLIVGFLFTTGEIKQVQGTTTGLFGQPGDTGETIYLLVDLDEGDKVKVWLPNNVPYIKGSRVIATEKTTRLFGIKRYSFFQYVEPDKPSNDLLEPIR
jgi:hypothetical protein